MYDPGWYYLKVTPGYLGSYDCISNNLPYLLLVSLDFSRMFSGVLLWVYTDVFFLNAVHGVHHYTKSLRTCIIDFKLDVLIFSYLLNPSFKVFLVEHLDDPYDTFIGVVR